MSKNYQKSINHCGREINYPRFGNIQEQQDQAQRGLAPPPGVDVLPSPCEAYYASKNVKDIDENCKNCLYESWTIDGECDCRFDPNNMCEFMDCVNKSKKCNIVRNALFNVDDVQDEYYKPPFTMNDVQGCTEQVTPTPNIVSSISSDSTNSTNSASQSSTSKSLAIAFGVAGLLALIGIVTFAILYYKRKNSRDQQDKS